MKVARVVLCSFGLVFGACAVNSPSRFGVSDVQEELDSRPPLFADEDIAQVEALVPQLPAPFRLGVAPPLSVDLDRDQDWLRRGQVREPGFGTWSAEEVAVIEEWGRRFREAGIVSEVVLMPRLLVGKSTEALLPELRRAAARQHVDAVLIVNRASASQTHWTPWTILDLTLVGAYVVPSCEVSSIAVAEAALVDVRNGYLYASSRGDASVKRHVPSQETEKGMDKMEAKARVRALKDLGEGLRMQAVRVGMTGMGP